MRTAHKRSIVIVSIVLLAVILAACGSPDQKKAKFFEKGKTLYEKGDYVKARLEFKNAIQIDPKFSEAYYMLGMTELKEGNFKQAYAAFSKTVDLSPDHLNAQLQLGHLFLLEKEPDKARNTGSVSAVR